MTSNNTPKEENTNPTQAPTLSVNPDLDSALHLAVEVAYRNEDIIMGCLGYRVAARIVRGRLTKPTAWPAEFTPITKRGDADPHKGIVLFQDGGLVFLDSVAARAYIKRNNSSFSGAFYPPASQGRNYHELVSLARNNRLVDMVDTDKTVLKQATEKAYNDKEVIPGSFFQPEEFIALGCITHIYADGETVEFAPYFNGLKRYGTTFIREGKLRFVEFKTTVDAAKAEFQPPLTPIKTNTEGETAMEKELQDNILKNMVSNAHVYSTPVKAWIPSVGTMEGILSKDSVNPAEFTYTNEQGDLEVCLGKAVLMDNRLVFVISDVASEASLTKENQPLLDPIKTNTEEETAMEKAIQENILKDKVSNAYSYEMPMSGFIPSVGFVSGTLLEDSVDPAVFTYLDEDGYMMAVEGKVGLVDGDLVFAVSQDDLAKFIVHRSKTKVISATDSCDTDNQINQTPQRAVKTESIEKATELSGLFAPVEQLDQLVEAKTVLTAYTLQFGKVSGTILKHDTDGFVLFTFSRELHGFVVRGRVMLTKNLGPVFFEHSANGTHMATSYVSDSNKVSATVNGVSYDFEGHEAELLVNHLRRSGVI